MVQDIYTSRDSIKKTFCVSYFLLGDSAKHFNDEVSTTVSQKVTTGSATLISKKTKW